MNEDWCYLGLIYCATEDIIGSAAFPVSLLGHHTASNIPDHSNARGVDNSDDSLPKSYIIQNYTLASDRRRIDLYAFPVLLCTEASCDSISSVFLSADGNEFILAIACNNVKSVVQSSGKTG